MRQVAMLIGALSMLSLQTGCDTSCGRRGSAILWSDGIQSERGGVRTYETTALNDTWLHFPSYRRFRLPHGFGTREVSIETYVSLAEDAPAANGEEPTKFAVTMAGEVLATVEDADHVVVENETCENDYFLFVRIKAPSASNTTVE